MSYTQTSAGYGAARGHWVIEAFLLTAMALVALAVGIGLYLQLAVTLWTSAGAALAVYIVLVSAHTLIRRSETIAMLQRQVRRLEREIARSRGAPARRAAEPGPEASLSALQRRPAEGPGDAAAAQQPLPPRFAPPPAARGRSAPSLPDAPPLRTGPRAPAIGPAPQAPTLGAPRAGAAEKPESAAVANPGMKAEPASAPSVTIGPELADSAAAAQPQPESAGADMSSVAADVDAINGIIQRLAAEMDALPDGAAAESSGSNDAAARASAASTADAGIAASVDGLRTAAASMRRSEAEALKVPGMRPIRAAAPAPGQVAPPPVGAAHARLSDLAEAITAQRIDLFLEPVCELAERRPQHSEFSVRLRTRHNESLGASDYVSVARGTGMLPLLDALRISRLARVAALKLDQSQSGLLFCQVSGESLTSGDFLNRLGEIGPPRSPLAQRLVLSFDQADVRQFTPPQWAALARLAEGGLSLAVDDVTALEMKVTTLRAGGFKYMRLGAARLIEGLPGRQGPTTGRDLCRLVAQADLSLVATGIEDERQLAELQALGVALGSGPLLGAPRAIMVESPAATGGVAA